MVEDSMLLFCQSEEGYERNDAEEENILCHSHNSLNLEITGIRKKSEKLYCHPYLSIYFILMLINLS
jgi:hypothetical protein